MSRKKIILIIILLIAAGGIWYGYKEYTRTNKDLSRVNADIKIDAMDIIHEYEADDSAANKKYLGKIVEVTGKVKNITRDDSGFYTVVLGDAAEMSAVRCSMDTLHHKDAGFLTTGATASIRGNCTGFNKDEMGLGSDVILNFSVIVPHK